jgi:hypothetical protein
LHLGLAYLVVARAASARVSAVRIPDTGAHWRNLQGAEVMKQRSKSTIDSVARESYAVAHLSNFNGDDQNGWQTGAIFCKKKEA